MVTNCYLKELYSSVESSNIKSVNKKKEQAGDPRQESRYTEHRDAKNAHSGMTNGGVFGVDNNQ